jgi:hypothetical protein
MLVPKNNGLLCRICKKEFKMDHKIDDYIIVKTIKHSDKDFAPIVIKERIKNKRISSQVRKTYEEFFQAS